MSAKRDREEEIFDTARELATGERAAYLAEKCGEDADLRQRIEAMLEADAAAGEFFKTEIAPPSSGMVADANLPPSIEKVGDRIGRYKLLEQIGEGGMGLVYMAEQDQPVRRSVALKIIKLGMDTRQVVARFEAERQALAMMNHPHIAKVFDAGATDSGRPYFVMELVRGIPITEYCDKNCLPTRQRLELFILVCQAVQHAHQKGIIHRDLKPSNILVTLNDGVPWPMIIDFGIAKATHQRLTEKTLFTHFAQMIGTPAYMSPEQAEMSKLDVDTRSDIYSLGVLLYELLTGTTPFPTKEILSLGYREMQRTIAESEPPRLSIRLSTMAKEERTVVAKNRSVDGTALAKLFRGDLDWIAMKCLEKDRARRYETANALATDIRRHLDCEPVVARPPSRLYEFQKTVRRHKFGFAAAGAVIMSLAIGLAVASSRFVRERQAHQRAVAAEEDARRKQAEAEAAREKLQRSEREKHHNLYVAEMHLARSAWEEGQLGKAIELLRSHLPEPGQEDLRGFEWRYLWQLCQGDALATLSGHKDFVQCLALSPDGRLLATGSGDGAIKLWDAVTRREIATLPPPSTNSVRSLVFSPSGKALAAAYGSTTLRLWDADTHREIGVLEPLPREHKVVQFFSDGRLLACAATDGAVTLWDVEKKTQVGNLQGSETRRPAIAISPDGATIAAASGHRDILLWDVATGRRLAVLQGHTANVVSLKFSPDGVTLASSSADTTIRLWDVASCRELTVLMGHKVWVSSVAFSPDGRRLVSTSVDGLIKLWDVASRAELGILRGHNAWVNEAAFFPDGRMLVSVSDDRTVKFWDTTFLAEGMAQKGQIGPATDFQFMPDGKSLAVLAPDGNLTFWDVASGKQTVQLAGRFKGFSESGRLILGEPANGELEIWDSVSRQVVTTIRGQKGSPLMAACSSDDRFIACADREGTLRVWEVATGRLLGRLPGATRFLDALWFPGGVEGLVLGFQRLSEASWARPLFSLRSLEDFNVASTIDASEKFRFWDLQMNREMEGLPGNVQRVRQTYEDKFSLSLVRDRLGGVRVESVARSVNHPTKLISFLPGSDGKMIIVGGERDITLWNIGTGRRVATLVGHGGWVTGLALSADGRSLASAANDGALKLWNLALRREVITFPGRISPHTKKVAFAPDGNSIAAFSWKEDQLVRLFHAPSLKEIDETEALKKATSPPP